MDAATWLALVVYSEARGEMQDGKAAVARVVLNRVKAKYYSDGTIKNTILRKDQFSEFWFAFVGGRYTRVCTTYEQAEARAEQLLVEARKHPSTWALCTDAADKVLSGHYSGHYYDNLTDDALLYCNRAICNPRWAVPDKLVCTIQHHSFYRK